MFLVELHPNIDIRAIFGYEPIHALFLGTNRFSKECLSSYLKDCERVSSTMPDKMVLLGLSNKSKMLPSLLSVLFSVRLQGFLRVSSFTLISWKVKRKCRWKNYLSRVGLWECLTYGILTKLIWSHHFLGHSLIFYLETKTMQRLHQYLHCMLTWRPFYSGVGLSESGLTKIYLNMKTKLKSSKEKRWRCLKTVKLQEWAQKVAYAPTYSW